MEELWENYLNALENNLPTKFEFMNFFNFAALRDGFSENDKIYVIRQYAKEKGYIEISGNQVSITKNGLKEFQKDTHDMGHIDLKKEMSDRISNMAILIIYHKES